MGKKRIEIGGSVNITDAMLKAVKATNSLDASFNKIKDSIVQINENGTRVAATLKLIAEDGRTATVNMEKHFKGQQRGWQVANTLIQGNEKATRDQSIATQKSYAAAYDAAQRYNNKLKEQEIAAQKSYAAAYDAAHRYNNKLKEQEIAAQKAYAVAYDAAHRYNNKLKEQEIAAQKAYSVAYDAAHRYNRKLDEQRASMGRINKQVQTFLLSWQSVARIFIASAVRRALFGISSAIRQSVDAAKTLEIRISEIRTIAQDVQLPFENWAANLRELSDEFGFDILDQAEAAYQTLSNQVAKGAETFKFLSEANKLARVAVTNTATSVDVLSSVINAYQLDAREAEAVSASLFKTVELGRLRLEELKGSYGDIAILARQLGVEYTELGAAVDTLTIQGLKYNKAATQLRGIFIKLIKPSKEMVGYLREMGFETGEAAIRALGFGEFMRRLQKRAKGSSTELAKYITRVRGLSGALAFAGEGFDVYTNAVEAQKKALEDYDNAQKIAIESAGFTVERELTRIKNFFTEEFGREIISSLDIIIKATGGLVPIFRVVTNVITATVIPAVTLLTARWIANSVAASAAAKANALAAASAAKAAFAQTGSAQAAATAAAASSAAAKASAASFIGTAGILIAEFVAIYSTVSSIVENKLEEAAKAEQKYFENRRKVLSRETDRATKEFEKITDEQLKALKDQEKDLNRISARIFGDYNKQIDDTVDNIKDINDEVKKSFSEVQKGFKNQIKSFEDIEKAATDNIQKIGDTVADLAKAIRQEKFDIRLADASTAAEQIQLLEGRLKQLEQATEVSLVFGDVDRVNELIKERFALEKQITKIARETAEENTKAAQERANIVKSIAEAEAKLKERNTKAEANEIRKEILDLRKELSEITIEDLGEYFTNYEKRYDDLLVKAKEINKRIIDDQIEKQEEAHKKRVALEIQLFNLTSDLTAFREFDVGEVAETGSIEDINKALKEQTDLYHDIIRQQEQLGIDGLNQGRLRLSLEESAGVAELEIRKKILKQSQDQHKIFIEQIEKRRKEVEKYNNELAESANAYRAQAEILAERIANQGWDFTVFETDEWYAAYKAIKAFGETFKDTFQPQNAEATLETITKLREEFIAAGGKATNTYITRLDHIANQIVLIQENLQKTDRSFLGNAESVSRQYVEFINQQKELLGIKKAQTEEDQTQKSLIESNTELLKKYRENLEKFIGVQRKYVPTITIPPQETFATGGKVQAKGVDRIPALLSPGEFVMNAAATRKFYGSLVAMNNGRIRSFANGGPVTNVGDVNISLNSSGNEAVDIVRIGKGLRRAIRRKKVQW